MFKAFAFALPLLLLIAAACGNDRSRGGPRPRPDTGSSDGGTGDGAALECETDADCEALSMGCATATCAAGSCNIESAAPDGTTCDDGDPCTEDDFCTAGRCAGSAPDCSAFDEGACVLGACDPATGACAATPVPDGTTCEDGAVCTDADVCMGGSCVAGDDLDCSSLTDGCNVGMCDEAAGGCVAVPLADGVSCDDADGCTTGDQCVAGACVGSALDCSSLDGECSAGVCDPSTGACVADPVVDGSACDDGDYCTRVDRCAAGTCLGTSPVDCTTLTDQCNTGMCDPSTGGCVPIPLVDGTSCDDGDAICTPGADTCVAGVCTGADVCCGADDFRLNEMAGGSPDFVEIINTGTCTLDASIVSLRFQGACDSVPLSYTFPVGTMVAPGGVVRVIDQSTTGTGEHYYGDNICHYEDDEGWAMLCEGPCSAGSCANTLDYFEQTITGSGRPTGYASCATFSPSPLAVSSALSTQSSTRVAFSGGGAAGQRADWALRTVSR